MKCMMAQGAAECDRCSRKSFVCTFREHRRGRKLGTRYENRSLIQGIIESYPHDRLKGRINREGPCLKGSRSHGSQGDTTSLISSTSRKQDTSIFWTRLESLQPDGLLSQQAIKGNFSLQNVLSTNHISATLNDVSASIPANDPVVSCLINYQVALSLFEK